MSLGNNRDYTTRDRSTRRVLAVTAARTKDLIEGGMSNADASRQSFEELRNGELRERLNAWIDPILAHKREMRKRNSRVTV
jgi:hypothetical protein